MGQAPRLEVSVPKQEGEKLGMKISSDHRIRKFLDGSPILRDHDAGARSLRVGDILVRAPGAHQLLLSLQRKLRSAKPRRGKNEKRIQCKEVWKGCSLPILGSKAKSWLGS